MTSSTYQGSAGAKSKTLYCFAKIPENKKLFDETLIVEIQPVVLEDNEYQCREDSVKTALFALSSHRSPHCMQGLSLQCMQVLHFGINS